MHTIIHLQTPPERSEMDALLREYYQYMAGHARSVGATNLSDDKLDEALQEFWDDIDDFLPPNGCLLQARDSDGRLAGTGSLRRLPSGAGEMKRLFVRPEARGSGLGRQLVEERIEAARDMGIPTLLVDTIRNNAAMLALYDSLGFHETGPFPESATYHMFPEQRDIMVFLRLDLK